MPGIPREVIEHNLKIYPDATPVRQKPLKQSVERQNFIREEVRKLLHAGFIEEVHHPEWLANPVVIPKANGKLRMLLTFTNAPDLYTASARFMVAFPLEYSPKVYQSVDRQ